MLKLSCLRDAFRDVDLALETRYARVGSVWLGHDTADTASDFLRMKQFLIGHLHSAMLIPTRSDRFIAGVLILVKFKVLLSIDFRFEEHVLLSFALAVNLH